MADGTKLVISCATLGYAVAGATVAAAMAAEGWSGCGNDLRAGAAMSKRLRKPPPMRCAMR